MIKKEFERDILKAIYLKTWSCLTDLYEDYRAKKKKSRYAPLREEIYYELLKIAGLAEEDNKHCYKITEKGLKYIQLI